MRKNTLLIFCLVLFAACSTQKNVVVENERALAAVTEYNVDPALKNINWVSTKAKKEEVVVLSNASIVFADYALLKKDFSELRNFSNDEIDQWLLKNTAVMSKPQALQQVTNTPIHSYATKSAYRPPDYGRALVIPVASPGLEGTGNEIGLIDAKGVGSLTPGQFDHGNGLATLGECIREFVYEKMVNRLFVHSESGLKTVGSYAVINAGFDIKHSDKSTSPAGIVLRQAHARYEGKLSLFDETEMLKVEKVLRRYGVTSAGAYRYEDIERLNIQGTKRGAVLDFGGFLTVEKFVKPGKHFYHSKIIIDPSLPGAIQPDESVRVPLNIWGTTVSGKEDPKLDNIWLWSHELANSLRNGTANRYDANQHVRNLLGPVFEKLNQAPGIHIPGNCTDFINSFLH